MLCVSPTHPPCTTQRRCFEYAPGISIDIQEGALGDGLGARVWLVAHLLARQLAHAPLIVAGKSVLELGAGCGVAGIVAAKVGVCWEVERVYVERTCGEDIIYIYSNSSSMLF